MSMRRFIDVITESLSVQDTSPDPKSPEWMAGFKDGKAGNPPDEAMSENPHYKDGWLTGEAEKDAPDFTRDVDMWEAAQKKKLAESSANMTLDARGKLPMYDEAGRMIHVYAFKVLEPFDFYLMVGQAPSNDYYGSSQIYRGVFRKMKAQPGQIMMLLHNTWRFVKGGKAFTMRLEPPKASSFEKSYGDSSAEYQAAGLIKDGKLAFANKPAAIDYNPSYQQLPQGTPVLIESSAGKKKVSLTEDERRPALDNEEAAKVFSAFMAKPRTREEALALIDRGDVVNDDHFRNMIASDRDDIDWRPYFSGFFRMYYPAPEGGPALIVWRALRRYAYEMNHGEPEFNGISLRKEDFDDEEQALQVGMNILRSRRDDPEIQELNLEDEPEEWFRGHLDRYITDPRIKSRGLRAIGRFPADRRPSKIRVIRGNS